MTWLRSLSFYFDSRLWFWLFQIQEFVVFTLVTCGGAWRSLDTKATIMTASFITSIVPVILLRPLWGLSILETLRKLWSRFLKSRKVLVENLFFGAFIRLIRGSMAPKTANICFLDPGWKVKGGFSPCGTSGSELALRLLCQHQIFARRSISALDKLPGL